MQLTLTLCLPRDEMTVPVARHVVRSSLAEVGVSEDCVTSVELALSEACTNVLKHSGPGDEYEVSIELDIEQVTIRVIDRGHGFDFVSLADDGTDLAAERGRGISLMHALVDSVKFESQPELGTIVHLVKSLQFDEGSVVTRLAARRVPAPPAP